MSSLPEEIYLEILLRVPVKSTFVCKYVCKSWFHLVSDPDFAKMHLNHTITNEINNCKVMFASGDSKTMYSVSYNSLSNGSDNNNNDFVKMDFPYKSLNSISLFGSCNGVVYFWNDMMHLYYLWNPATKECKKLPKSGTNYYNYIGQRYHGFGYDYVADDYKLVELVRNEDDTTSLQVYSLKSNSWKGIQSIQYELITNRPTTRVSRGVLLNGALHWFGGIPDGASSIVIISMDINQETFKEMQLPTTLSMRLPKWDSYIIDMGVLEGHLCIHAYENRRFEVWVMMDYGVPESWTKLNTIIALDVAWFGSCYYETSFKNGDVLFRKLGGPLILCDPKYGNARKSNIRGLVGSALSYSESLVSLKSISTVGRGKKRGITGNSKKRKR